MKSKNKNNRYGFTILEVCLVVVIMGIIAASVVPSFNIIYRQNAKRLADTFLLDMQKQREKGTAMPKVKYYIRLDGNPTAITISGVGATGYDSYVTGNEKFDGEPETDTLPKIPGVPQHVSEPYKGTHPKVTMGMLIDGTNAGMEEVYFDRKGAYTLGPSGTKDYVDEIMLGVYVDGKERYNIKIDGLTGKTTWIAF